MTRSTRIPESLPPLLGSKLGPIMAIVVITSVATAWLVVEAASHVSMPVEFFIGVTTLGVAAYPIAHRFVTRSFDVFEPVVAGCVMLAILFGARPIWMVMSGDMTADQGRDGIFDVSVIFTRVTVLGLVATLCFVAGYEITARRRSVNRRAARTTEMDPDGFRAFAVVASTLGAGLFLIHLQLGGGIVRSLRLMLGGRSGGVTEQALGSSEYLSAAPILIACIAIVLVAIKGPQMGRADKLAAVAAALVPTLLALLLGNRRFVIPSAVIPIAAYYLVTKRRPSLSRLAIVVPVVFILLSTLIFARSSGAREQAGGVAPIFEKAFAAPGDVWTTFIGGHDTAMIAWLGVELQSLDSGVASHTFGAATAGDLLLAPVPSQIVPFKPITARDGLLIDLFGKRCIEGTCPDFAIVGTFYQDFAYPGVIIGMLLLGYGAARVWGSFVNAPSDPGTIILAAAVAVFLPIIIRAGFMPGFAWFLYFVIPSMMGLHFAMSRTRPARQV